MPKRRYVFDWENAWDQLTGKAVIEICKKIAASMWDFASCEIRSTMLWSRTIVNVQRMMCVSFAPPSAGLTSGSCRRFKKWESSRISSAALQVRWSELRTSPAAFLF